MISFCGLPQRTSSSTPLPFNSEASGTSSLSGQKGSSGAGARDSAFGISGNGAWGSVWYQYAVLENCSVLPGLENSRRNIASSFAPNPIITFRDLVKLMASSVKNRYAAAPL